MQSDRDNLDYHPNAAQDLGTRHVPLSLHLLPASRMAASWNQATTVHIMLSFLSFAGDDDIDDAH